MDATAIMEWAMEEREEDRSFILSAVERDKAPFNAVVAESVFHPAILGSHASKGQMVAHGGDGGADAAESVTFNYV